jgi:hypothetical protein
MLLFRTTPQITSGTMLHILVLIHLTLYESAFARDTKFTNSHSSPLSSQSSSPRDSFGTDFMDSFRPVLALPLALLFISPLARNHVLHVCSKIPEKVLLHYTLAHRQISGYYRFKQTLTLENSQLRADLDIMKADLTAEQNRVVQLQRGMKRRKTFISALQNSKELYRINESQSDEIKRLKEVIANLNTTIDSKIDFHNSKITDLKLEIDKLATAGQTTQKHLADSRQERITSRDEIDRLRSELDTQTAQHQASLSKLERDHSLEMRPYKGAIETLFRLSESTGDYLVAAAIFADALKSNGVSLARLGIDERRARVLCEFVGRGQFPGDPVQPQTTVLGFSLDPPRAPARAFAHFPALVSIPAAHVPIVPIASPQSEEGFLSFEDLLEYQRRHREEQHQQQRLQHQQQQYSVSVLSNTAPAAVPTPAPFSLWAANIHQQIPTSSAAGNVGVPLAVPAPLAPARVDPKPASRLAAELEEHYSSKKKRRQRW